MLLLLAWAVFGGTIAGLIARQLLGRGPDLWMILAGGGVLTVATGGLSPQEAAETLGSNLPVFAFLIALFLFVAALDRAGVFEHLAKWVIARARTPVDLPPLLFVGFALLSTFLLNDALVLVGIPVVFSIARRVSVPVRPLLMSVAFAVTVGSVLTPMGNPQNLLVALGSGLPDPVATFLRYLLLPTLLNVGAGALYVRWRYRGLLAGMTPPAPRRTVPVQLLPRTGWPQRLARAPVLLVFPLTMCLIVGADLFGALTGAAALPIYLIALVGAGIVLATSRKRATLIARLDWSILILFAGLFLVVAGAQSAGLLSGLEHTLMTPGPGAPRADSLGAVFLTSLVGPQIVSNVPWVALQIPLLHSVGYGASTPVIWVALAAGSTLAGNLTILGAASNLIIVEQAESRGTEIRLMGFVRDGLPLVAITTAILFLALLLGV